MIHKIALRFYYNQPSALLFGFDLVARLAPEMKNRCRSTKNMISKNLDDLLLEEAAAMTNVLSLAIPHSNYTTQQEKFKIFQTVLEAIKEGQSLALSYQSPHYDHQTASFIVIPWRLSFDNRDWTLWAGDAIANKEGHRHGRKLQSPGGLMLLKKAIPSLTSTMKPIKRK